MMRFYTGIEQLIFEDNCQFPIINKIEKIQSTERSAAGTLHVESFAIKIKSRELNFDLMSRADYDALKDWFDNIADGSKNSFYFVDEEENTNEVRITSKNFDFQEDSYQRYSGKLTLEFLD